MKKKYFIIPVMMFCTFIFNAKVLASDVKISCENAKTDEPFKCTVTTNKKVTIKHDGLTLYSGSSILEKSGEVEFKTSKASSYDISLTYLDENGNESITTTTVKVSENVTTTKKTTVTTTTTTKKTTTKSSNNYLKSISIDGEELTDFSKEKNRYEYTVTNKITKVNIEANVEDASSTVKIDGPKTLAVGDNTYTISVTSEDNTTKYYKVIITRDEEISNNTKIDSINIKGYDLKVDGSSKTYYLDVKSGTKSLDIDVTLSDEKAAYDIEGNENLSNGSIIKIIVTAQNNDTSTYRIIINMPEEKKSSTLLIVIIIIIVFLIIGGISTYFIIKKKNSKKKNNNKKDNKDNKKEEKDDDISSNDYDDSDDEIDSDELEKTKILTFDNYDDETTKTINFEDFNF